MFGFTLPWVLAGADIPHDNELAPSLWAIRRDYLFAGNLQGKTQTMPLLVYSIFERDIDAAIWTGLVLIVLAMIALFLSQSFARAQDRLT